MDDIDLQIIVCGMHLIPKFGETCAPLNLTAFRSLQSRSRTVRRYLRGVAAHRHWRCRLLEGSPALAPDLVIILAIASSSGSGRGRNLLNIPIAHIHGGEVTAGAFDDASAMRSPKWPACISSQPNLIGSASFKWRNPDYVFNVAPGLDQATYAPAWDHAALFKALVSKQGPSISARNSSPDDSAPEADDATITLCSVRCRALRIAASSLPG